MEEIDITIYVNSMERSAMKVAQLRVLLEKRCETVPGKNMTLKNTRKGTFARDSVTGLVR